jgi:phosphoglycerol transferase MdoB-like AlkP superfamily enzyme
MTSTHKTPTPMQRCGVLTASALALWALLAGPAYWLAGTLGLEGLTYSALLCVVPGCLLFLAIPFFEFAQNKAYAFLVGSGLRMFVVLVSTLVLHEIRADLGLKEFLSWLVVFYSVTLLVETLLIVKLPEEGTTSGSSKPGNVVTS